MSCDMIKSVHIRQSCKFMVRCFCVFLLLVISLRKEEKGLNISRDSDPGFKNDSKIPGKA